MKKTLTAALAAILLVTSLTGCNSDNEPNDSSDSSISNTSSDNTSSDSGSSDNTSSDSGSSDNASGDSGSSDNTSSGSVSGESSSDPGEESYPTPAETLEFPDTKSGRMVKAALEFNPEDWSAGLTLDDGQILPVNFPELTVDMFEDYCYAFDMIGINGHTVFAGKAKAGQEDAVKTAIEKNLDTLKQNSSFYPAGQESVAGAVNGTSDDGYYYFVFHANGSDVASAMLAVGV